MRRIAGVDIARGLALLGMFVAHAAPPYLGEGITGLLLEVPDERSRLLFALTAGLGLGLLTAGPEPRGVLRRQIAVRAVFLLALGLLLQDTGVLVRVILDEYGIAFLLMLPFVFLPAGWLLGAGVVLLIFGPGVAVLLGAQVTPAERVPYAQLVDWFVTGSYPVVTWVAVLMIGVAIVRLGLFRTDVVAVAGLLGLGAMVGGIGLSVGLGGDGIEAEPAAAQVGLTAAAVGTSAFTVGNVGFCLALTALLVAVSRRGAGLLRPIAEAGAMPLSVYTAHLLVLLAVTRVSGGFRTDDGWPVVIGLAAGALTLPWLWRRFLGRGPLERVVGALSGRVPAAGRRSRPVEELVDRGVVVGQDHGVAPVLQQRLSIEEGRRPGYLGDR
jgi:hypothetical protein